MRLQATYVRGSSRLGIAATVAAGMIAMAAPSGAAFVDVTTPVLVPSTGELLGVSWADYDGDADLDLYYSNFNGLVSGTLLRNDGATIFRNATSAVVQNLGQSVASSAWGDFDEDGDLDVYLNCDTGNRLARNDGGGSFADVTTPSLVPDLNARSSAWVDTDRDGDLDLSLAGITAGFLARNDGGNFVNATISPLDNSCQAISWTDFNGDGLPDAFYSVQSGANVLARNNGNGTFSNVANGALTTTTSELGSYWGDFDNDLDPDCFVIDLNGVGGSTLARNDGGTFANANSGALTTGSSARSPAWADFDNDGDLDLVVTYNSSVRLIRNDGSAGFADASTLIPALAFGYDAASWGDYDSDGDVDLSLGATVAANTRLLRNDQPAGNHWLHVDLVGTISNRSGSGARITIQAGGINQMRDVFAGGGGWCSSGSLTAEFGLGSATSVATLTVRWPLGDVQTFVNLPVDRVMTITEPGFAPVAALQGGFQPGQPFDLAVERRGVNVTTATLFFRAAGTATFSSGATMTIDAVGDRMTAAVASVTASENGVEYFILYRANSGTTRSFPIRGSTTPAFLPANLGTRAQPTAFVANEYGLFALPFTGTNPSLGGVLEDDLGAYNNTKWRFGRFSPTAGAYLEAGSAGSMTPGRGFWLVERTPVAVDADGLSTNTVGGTTIPVDPGWNQIGHPYLFTVPTSQVDRSNAPNVTNRFVARVGGAYQDVTTLEPWKGYWVFNGGTGTQTIVIPGQVGLPPSAPPSIALAARLEGHLDVLARTSTSADLDNVAGTASASGAAEFSLPEPPGLPGTVRVYFEREPRDGAPAEWTTDVRASGAPSESYDLVVEVPDEPALLSFDGLETLPAGNAALLLNDVTLSAIDVTEETRLALPANRTHRFRLVIGTESAIDAARAGRDRLTGGIELAAPHPNPFAGATTIAFAIPSNAVVHLDVFDVAGRLVRELADGAFVAGVHRVSWNGADDAGVNAAAGVYFAKLSTGGSERIQKIVLIK